MKRLNRQLLKAASLLSVSISLLHSPHCYGSALPTISEDEVEPASQVASPANANIKQREDIIAKLKIKLCFPTNVPRGITNVTPPTTQNSQIDYFPLFPSGDLAG